MHPSVARAVEVVAQMSEIDCLRQGWAAFDLDDEGELCALGWSDEDDYGAVAVLVPERREDAAEQVRAALLRERDGRVLGLSEQAAADPSRMPDPAFHEYCMEDAVAHIALLEGLLGDCPITINPHPWDFDDATA